MPSLEKKLQAWKPIRVGTRVRLVCPWRNGATGTVAENLSETANAANQRQDNPYREPMNGFARYGVRLDMDHDIADCLRYELKVVKPKGKRP